MWDSAERRAIALVFVFLFSLYAITGSGRLGCPQGESMFQVTRSLVERAAVDIPPIAPSRRGVDGRYFSPYGLWPSLAAAPFYVMGRMTVRLAPPESDRESWLRLWCSLANVAATAITAALVTAFCCLLGCGVAPAAGAGLTYGLATYAWQYARIFYPEAWCAALLAAACLGVVVARATGRWQPARWAGVAAGLAVMSDVYAFTVTPLLLLYVAWPRGGEGAAWDARAARAFLATAGLLIFGVMCYNAMRFASPFVTGSLEHPSGVTPSLWRSVWSYLVSQQAGWLWYAPVLFFSLAGWALLRQRQPGPCWLLCGLVVVWAAPLCMQGVVIDEYAWGPRQLLPVLFAAVAPLAELYARLGTSEWWLKRMMLITVLVSVAVQLIALPASYHRFYLKTAMLEPSTGRFMDRLARNPYWSQLVSTYEISRAAVEKVAVAPGALSPWEEMLAEQPELNRFNLWFVQHGLPRALVWSVLLCGALVAAGSLLALCLTLGVSLAAPAPPLSPPKRRRRRRG